MLSSKQKSGQLQFCTFSDLDRKVCNINYINVAALTPTLKIAWDKITLAEVRDICAALQCKIMAAVKNGEDYSE